MSVTAVPIQPIKKGSIAKYWAGVAVVIAAGTGLAWIGTSDIRSKYATNEQFLAGNAGQDGVTTTKSGLQIKTIRSGEGKPPTDNDVAMVKIKGELRDGTVFQPEAGGPFPVAGGIPGFTEALKLMQPGGKYKIWIPSELGYGATPPQDPQTGQPALPANSVLIFDVELQGFGSREEFEAAQKAMQEQQAKQRKVEGTGGGAGGPGGGGLPPDIQRQLEEAMRQQGGG